MKNRRTGKNLPEGYARENFYLCREGIAVRMPARGKEIARDRGFSRLLCVCDRDNTASEKVILQNGGVLEDTRFDPEKQVTVKRYRIGF